MLSNENICQPWFRQKLKCRVLRFRIKFSYLFLNNLLQKMLLLGYIWPVLYFPMSWYREKTLYKLPVCLKLVCCQTVYYTQQLDCLCPGKHQRKRSGIKKTYSEQVECWSTRFDIPVSYTFMHHMVSAKVRQHELKVRMVNAWNTLAYFIIKFMHWTFIQVIDWRWTWKEDFHSLL